MIPDLDIYRSANLLVKQHGEDAPKATVARVLLHDAGLLDRPRELSLTYSFIAKGSGTSRYDGCVQLPRGSRSRR